MDAIDSQAQVVAPLSAAELETLKALAQQHSSGRFTTSGFLGHHAAPVLLPGARVMLHPERPADPQDDGSLPPVTVSLESLQHTLREVGDKVSRLHERLGPVLDTKGLLGATCKPNDPQQCPLVETLRALTGQAQAVSDELSVMLENLQL